MQNLILIGFSLFFSDCDDFIDPVDHICLFNSVLIRRADKKLNFVWEPKLQITICNVSDLNVFYLKKFAIPSLKSRILNQMNNV